MNERIKKLLAQCETPIFDVFNVVQQYVTDTEKFALLIVKECVESVGDVEEMFFNARIATDDFSEKNRFAEAETACEMAKQKIKRRFGVE